MAFLGCTTLAEAYVYVTCVLLGISMLMPLNALFSAPRYMVDYYKYVTGNPDAEPSSEVFWANILTFYNVASVTTQIVVGPTVLLPFARKLSLSVRFTGALLLMTSEVATILLMPVGHVSQGGAIAAFFIVTIAAGAGKSYLEATCYALVSSMDPKFMSAVMFGCGSSGVIASILQCIVKVTMGDSYDDILKQSYLYFSLAIGFMMVSLVMALSLRWNSYARIHVAEFRALAAAETGSTDTTPEVSEVAGRPMLPEDVEKAQREEARVRPDDKLEVDVHAVDDGSESDYDEEEERRLTTAEQLQRTKVWPVIRLIYPMQIACFTVFFVSLFIFPSLVIPVDRDSNWFATLAILFYNCGDAIGRLSTSFPALWPSRKCVLIVAFSRLIFVPLIFFCIYGYIPGHAPAYVLMAIVGLSNGFFGATSMVFGATTPGLKTAGQRVMAGQLMGISLLAGASLASLLALLVVLFIPQ